jgi:hypothetical protein
MEDKYPTVFITEGCNYLIQSILLCAQPHPYPKPHLTQKEEFIFCEGECFTPLVNQAVCMEGDITLWAEVIRYHRAMAKVYSLAHQITSLKRKCDGANWEVHNSEKRLAMADAYGCLEPHVLYGLQADKDITSVLKSGSVQFFDPKMGNWQLQLVPTDIQSGGTATRPGTTGLSQFGCLQKTSQNWFYLQFLSLN